MKYGIAVFPSKEISEAANELRKRYDPRFDFIAPHITLKGAFEADEQTLKQTKKQLEAIATEISPFRIEVNKVSSFAPVTNTIYFKVEPNETIIKLFDALHTDDLPGESEFNFVPHITVAQELAEDEISDVFGSLQMKHVQFEDTITAFHLCLQDEEGTWSAIETYALKGE